MFSFFNIKDETHLQNQNGVDVSLNNFESSIKMEEDISIDEQIEVEILCCTNIKDTVINLSINFSKKRFSLYAMFPASFRE